MTGRAVTAAACGAAVGLGTWATAGSVDRISISGAGAAVRVAMLPALPWLGVAMAAGALGAVLFGAVLARTGLRQRANQPLFVMAGAAVLALPYLPWLADLCPALMLLAGPGRWLTWAMLGALAAWTLALEGRVAAREASPDPTVRSATSPDQVRARARRWTTGILLASLVSSGVLAERFTRTPLFPGGDEPHYLVVAQSLWRDGDLRIENNHQRADYEEYFHRPLAPHYLTRGVDRQIYSIHPVGMPLLMAPVYAAGGYDAVVWALVLLSAMAMTWAWRLAWAVTGSAGAATFAWAVIALGPPWIFNTFAVYPEVPAACAVALAFALTAGWRPVHRQAMSVDLPRWRWWAAGAAIASLPWFSTKYVVMGAALGAVTLLRAWVPIAPGPRAARRAVHRTLAVVVPSAVSLAAWLVFFRVIWGTFSPAAPYGAQRETRLAYLPAGAPGLLFDQEYGVVSFAPALLMALPGLWALWQAGGARRRLGVELVAVVGGLLGVVGAFHIWWGGSAIVGRPLVSALPLLLLPVAAHWKACAEQPLRRAAQRILLCAGVALTVLLATAQGGLLLVAGRDGASQVLEYLAPSTPVWTLLPTFLRQDPASAWSGVVLWGGAALASGLGLGRLGTRLSGAGSQQAAAWWATLVVGAAVSALAAAALPPSTASPSLADRPRVRLLDEFDRSRRPLAIRYDPLTRLDAAAVPALFPIIVREAGNRRVERDASLFGRRLSLPAGTYALDLVFPGRSAMVAGALALHVGRTSPPLESWDVALALPGSWGRTFSLPVDVGYVGFRASDAIVQAAPQLRLTPQHIVNASERPQTPAVLGSARYGDMVVLVHGEDAWPEREGIWVRGRATATLSLVWPEQQDVVHVALRAGPQPVSVRVQWGDADQTIALLPGQRDVTALARPAERRAGASTEVAQLRITSSSAFVPAEIEAGSRDRRALGCWLEVGASAEDGATQRVLR